MCEGRIDFLPKFSLIDSPDISETRRSVADDIDKIFNLHLVRTPPSFWDVVPF